MFNLQIVILSHSGTGAGIYSVDAAPGYESRPIANNGVIIAGSTSNDRIRFECISNSSQTGVGRIAGLDGTTLSSNSSGYLRAIVSPGNRPGFIRFRAINNFTAGDQGIYTCTIPDANGNDITINMGLYPNGFDGECILEYAYMCISICI